jgi:hypothetical protein
MSKQRNFCRFVCFTTIFVVSVSLARATVLHQYDFEPASSPVTQSGWTHIDSTIAATPTTAGFVFADTIFRFTTVDRGSSTQSPVDVTRDLLIFRNNGNTSASGMRFQEIVPAFASSVLITMYRSDPGDNNGDAATSATASLNGGSQTTIGTGTGFGFYHTPITYTLAITPTGSTGLLDIRYFSTLSDSSDMRVNGISFEYTIQEVPEPSSIGLLCTGIAMLAARRWRQRG